MYTASPFFSTLAAIHSAEISADRDAMLDALLKVPSLTEDAPSNWRSPFGTDPFCSQHLLARCPAAFWRRLSNQHRGDEQLLRAIGAASSALANEDLLGIVVQPDTLVVSVGGMTLQLQEGRYHTGGIGRHLYAAATALATAIADREQFAHISLPSLRGRRVLELGCGLGLVGLDGAGARLRARCDPLAGQRIFRGAARAAR